jgi:ubiquitin-conjugating enzyme E2 O
VEASVTWLQKDATDDAPVNFKSMAQIEDEILNKYKFFKQFDTVENFSDHFYANKPVGKVTSCTYKHIALAIPFLHSDTYFFLKLHCRQGKSGQKESSMIGNSWRTIYQVSYFQFFC